MRTIDQALVWARANPKYTVKEGPDKGKLRSWAGYCEAFVNNSGGFDSFATALLAGNASGPLRKDWQNAPRGAVHYWSGVWVKGVECGHIAFSLGNGFLLMASSRVSNMGTALGTIHFNDYGLPGYRGWSMRHGTQTLAAPATAATSTKPLPASTPLPAIKGAHNVFILTRNGWTALVFPAENGYLYAQVLGGADKTWNFPIIDKLDGIAWGSFRERFINKSVLPA